MRCHSWGKQAAVLGYGLGAQDLASPREMQAWQHRLTPASKYTHSAVICHDATAIRTPGE